MHDTWRSLRKLFLQLLETLTLFFFILKDWKPLFWGGLKNTENIKNIKNPEIHELHKSQTSLDMRQQWAHGSEIRFKCWGQVGGFLRVRRAAIRSVGKGIQGCAAIVASSVDHPTGL